VTRTRLIRIEDAAELAEALDANAAFLAPYEPERPRVQSLDEHRRAIERWLRAHAEGSAVPHVILDGDRIVGRITLSNIVRFAFLSCTLGYWVAEADNGRGHATAAVARMCEIAFRESGLHRVEAGTLVDNLRSQRVLQHNGFERFGLAPGYLRIADRWQDHILFQRLSDAG
jgi:ribosomal-protein-alanine N-acetyltransferase